MTNNLSSDQYPTSLSMNYQFAPPTSSGTAQTPTQAYQTDSGATDQISTQQFRQGLLLGAELEALSVLANSSDAGGAGSTSPLAGSALGSTLSPESLLPYITGQQNANNLSMSNSSLNNTQKLLGSDSDSGYNNASSSGNNENGIISELLLALMMADSAQNSSGVGNGNQMDCGGQGDSGSSNDNLKKDLKELKQDLKQFMSDFNTDSAGASSDSDSDSNNELGSAIGHQGPGPVVTPKSINANSFDIKSYGDPHITSSFNGGATSKEDKMTDTNDVATFFTKDGNTTIGTTETKPDSKGITYNESVDINHGPSGLNDNGSERWDLTATDDNGKMTAVIKDGGKTGDKTTTLADGQSVTEGDGTTIANKDGKITVQQKTAEGGDLTETVTDNGKGLDVEAQGTKSRVTGEATDLYYNQQVSNPAT